MTPDPLTRLEVQSLLDQPVLARIATAHSTTGQPHVVPVWFAWDGESLWISSFSNTRKVRELKANPLCSILIEPSPGENTLQAVLMEGSAEIIDKPENFLIEMATRIYTRYLGPDGVLAPDPQSWMHDRLHLIIKLTPSKVYSW
jgi:nitroimidazol reductase NimA-like FMN-containing flavoprotein (pyridoxamine 5'-phosphate oxidase superfamily)